MEKIISLISIKKIIIFNKSIRLSQKQGIGYLNCDEVRFVLIILEISFTLQL